MGRERRGPSDGAEGRRHDSGVHAAGEGAAEGKGARGPLSPAKTFVALVAVVALVTAPSLLQKPARAVRAAGIATASPSPRATSPVSPPALTRARATAVFRSLRARLNRSIRERSTELLSGVFMRGSTAGARARSLIHRLVADRVVERTRVRTTAIHIVSTRPRTMVVRERATLRPCFVTDSGRDVTRGPSVLEQISVWRLRRQGSRWSIQGGRIVGDRALKGRHASCD